MGVVLGHGITVQLRWRHRWRFVYRHTVMYICMHVCAHMHRATHTVGIFGHIDKLFTFVAE